MFLVQPTALRYTHDQIRHIVLHELGHTLGLDHYADLHQGADQVMHPSSYDATAYRSGDRAGLRLLHDGRPPSGVAGDLDGDARVDVVWHETASRSLGVLWGGTLGLDLGWRTGVAAPAWAGVGDLDDDGDADVARYDAASRAITVDRGGPRGPTTTPRWATGLAPPRWAGVGDLDGDGDDDIAWLGTGGDVTLVRGGADGPTTTPRWATGFTAPVWVGVGDLDGDGDGDLVRADRRGTLTAVWGGPGATSTGTWATGLGRPVWAGAGDFDADGLDDVAWYLGDGSITMLWGGARATVEPRWAAGIVVPAWAGAGDVDADGDSDLVWYTTTHGRVDIMATGPDGPGPRDSWMIRIPPPTWASGGSFARTDGDGSPLFHPFTSAEALVDRRVADLLGRPATASERSLWVDALRSGAHDPADLVAWLRTSDDNRQRVDPVVRLYRAAFGRAPDEAGLAHWVARRRSGTSLTTIAEAFARSPELVQRYGRLTNGQYVDRIYRNVLGRAPDATGSAFWTAELDRGRRTRGQVLAGFSESSENRAGQRVRVDAAVVALTLVHRAPTAAEEAELEAERASPTAVARWGLDLAG